MFELFFIANLRKAIREWGSVRCFIGLIILALAVIEVVASCDGIIQLALQR